VSSEGASAENASTKEELEALVVKLKEENKKLSDHVYWLQSELLDVRTKENSQGRIASSNSFPSRCGPCHNIFDLPYQCRGRPFFFMH